MKSKLLLVMSIIMTCMLAQSSHAQTRYQDSIFASYTLDSVVYSNVTNFKMDIYQPAGDVSTSRPTVVLAHEGTFISGDRESDPTVTRLCADLAHRGYVAVSIDYTIASANPTNLLDSALAAVEVFKAIADCRAAVRFLYANVNTYGLDTNNIYVGGNSAGAVLAMHYAYVIDTSQFGGRKIFLNAVDSIGGTLQGNSGNPGHSSNVKGVISLAGGLNEAHWITQCSQPIVAAQGTLDSIVPYTCNFPVVFNGLATVPLQLCGLGSYNFYLANNVPYSSTLVFPNQKHVPWDTSAQMYYQVDTLVAGFLYKEVTNAVPTTCSGFPAGIKTVTNSDISLYPNPATDLLNIHSSEFISGVSVMDEMGRTISQISDIHSLDYTLNTSNLSTGIYFVRVYNEQQSLPTVRKVTIE